MVPGLLALAAIPVASPRIFGTHSWPLSEAERSYWLAETVAVKGAPPSRWTGAGTVNPRMSDHPLGDIALSGCNDPGWLVLPQIEKREGTMEFDDDFRFEKAGPVRRIILNRPGPLPHLLIDDVNVRQTGSCCVDPLNSQVIGDARISPWAPLPPRYSRGHRPLGASPGWWRPRRRRPRRQIR